jgi:hypothetical protein
VRNFIVAPSGTNSDISLAVGANLAPITSVPANALVTSGTAAAISNISVADPDAISVGETITVALSDSAGLLSANTNAPGGGGTISGSGTASLTISGSLIQVNADLSTVTDLENAAGTDTILVATNDGRGGSDSHQIAVAINAPPVTTVPGAQSVPAGVASPIAGVSVADADAVSAGETITVVLSDTSGQLSANSGAPGGGGTIGGAGTTGLTISGTLDQVNADLSTLTYLANTGGTDAITLATGDGRGGSDSQQIAVTATANAPPVTDVPGPQLAQAGVVTPIPGISVADADAIGAGETITVVLNDITGQLAANAVSSGGGGTISGSGTNDLTISGTLNQVNADLSTVTYLGSTGGADLIDVATDDGRGGSDDHLIAVAIGTPPAITTPGYEVVGNNNESPIDGISVEPGSGLPADTPITP